MAHCGERSGRTSAVSVPQDDNLVPSGGQLGRVHGSVVSLCAAVSEKRFLQTTGSNLRELLSEIGLRLVAVERRGMRDRLDLIDDGFINSRIGMSHADR